MIHVHKLLDDGGQVDDVFLHAQSFFSLVIVLQFTSHSVHSLTSIKLDFNIPISHSVPCNEDHIYRTRLQEELLFHSVYLCIFILIYF